MHVYRKKPEQKQATKIVTSFVNNTDYSFPKQYIENKNLFQCNGDLLTFHF